MFLFFYTIMLAIIYHVTAPKTFDTFRFQNNLTEKVNGSCGNCYRIYFPVCATDNKTYTNECKFKCLQSHKGVNDTKLKIRRFGPCILGERKKRFADYIKDLPDSASYLQPLHLRIDSHL